MNAGAERVCKIVCDLVEALKSSCDVSYGEKRNNEGKPLVGARVLCSQLIQTMENSWNELVRGEASHSFASACNDKCLKHLCSERRRTVMQIPVSQYQYQVKPW